MEVQVTMLMQAAMQAMWLWYPYGSVSAIKTSWSKVSMDAYYQRVKFVSSYKYHAYQVTHVRILEGSARKVSHKPKLAVNSSLLKVIQFQIMNF